MTFQLRTANFLKKMVVDTSESLKTSEVKHNLSLALLVENLIFSIGKAMKISSENAYFTNQNTTTVNMVCNKLYKGGFPNFNCLICIAIVTCLLHVRTSFAKIGKCCLESDIQLVLRSRYGVFTIQGYFGPTHLQCISQ